MATLLILLIAAIVIFVNYLIAEEYRSIAAQKGFGGRRYFWWCFFTGFIGYLMVVALPDRSRGSTGRTEKITY